MDGLKAPKNVAEAEAEVIGFIISRFQDQFPNLPLSQERLIDIFNEDFLSSIYYFSAIIAEGYAPSSFEIYEAFIAGNVDPFAFTVLTSMLGKFLEGASTVDFRELEEIGVSYDFVPAYVSTEEFRYLTFLHTAFSRVISYYHSES